MQYDYDSCSAGCHEETTNFEKFGNSPADYSRFRFTNTQRRKLRSKKVAYGLGDNGRRAKAIRW